MFWTKAPAISSKFLQFKRNQAMKTATFSHLVGKNCNKLWILDLLRLNLYSSALKQSPNNKKNEVAHSQSLDAFDSLLTAK